MKNKVDFNNYAKKFYQNRFEIATKRKRQECNTMDPLPPKNLIKLKSKQSKQSKQNKLFKWNN